MPGPSRWFVRASLIHLVAGFSLGGVLLIHKGLTLDLPAWRLLTPHIELLLIGWIVQLTMGVAFWILPRFGRGPARGGETAMWLVLVLLNGGVLAVCLASSLILPEWVQLSGRAAEAASALIFGIRVWPRVKPAEVRTR